MERILGLRVVRRYVAGEWVALQLILAKNKGTWRMSRGFQELQDLEWFRLTESVRLLFERLQQELHGVSKLLGRLRSLLGC